MHIYGTAPPPPGSGVTWHAVCPKAQLHGREAAALLVAGGEFSHLEDVLLHPVDGVPVVTQHLGKRDLSYLGQLLWGEYSRVLIPEPKPHLKKH